MSKPVVVVTGASAGIGRAAARRFAAEGWRVALLARSPEGLAGAQREIEAAGGEALVVPTDVADQEQVEAAADAVERAWGAIDVWVNNAMATVFCSALDVKPDDFVRATEVTYLGSVWGTLAALRRMKPRDRGAIVQVGSALAYRSIPLQSAYCGAKSAVRGFLDSLRSELIHDGSNVHLTMVQLSAFNTPQFDWAKNCMGKRPQPLGKIYQPEVAAEAIYWAATHQRRELWVGYPAVKAILGTRILPGFLDWRLAWQAWSGQLAEQDDPPDRSDNLYHPAPGDRGAHGRFDVRADASSWQLWWSTRRWRMTMVVLGALALLSLLALLVRG